MGWTPSNAGRNLWLYRLSLIAQNVDFTRGVFVIFLLHQGLANADVGILQAVLFWTLFLAELPTGIFADHVRRKVSVLIGSALLILTFTLFPFGEGMVFYTIVFVVWGLSFAFKSGAASALLYDGLKEAGPTWLARHVSELGRLRAISTLAMAASMAAAGWFYERAPWLVFALSAVFVAVAFVAMLAIKESPRPAVVGREGRSISAALFNFSRSARGKNMLVLMCGLALVEACHTPIFIFSQSYLKELGATPATLTVILSCNFAITALGMYLAPRINLTSLRWPVYLTAVSMAAIILLLTGAEHLFVAVPLLIIYNLLPNMLFVYTDHYIQENGDSEIRASWGSVSSFVTAISIGSSFIALGYFGDKYGMRNAFLLLLPVLLVATAIVSTHNWHKITHAAPEAA